MCEIYKKNQPAARLPSQPITDAAEKHPSLRTDRMAIKRRQELLSLRGDPFRSETRIF